MADGSACNAAEQPLNFLPQEEELFFDCSEPGVECPVPSTPADELAAERLRREVAEMEAAALRDVTVRLREQLAELMRGGHRSSHSSPPSTPRKQQVQVALQTEDDAPEGDNDENQVHVAVQTEGHAVERESEERQGAYQKQRDEALALAKAARNEVERHKAEQAAILKGLQDKEEALAKREAALRRSLREVKELEWRRSLEEEKCVREAQKVQCLKKELASKDAARLPSPAVVEQTWQNHLVRATMQYASCFAGFSKTFAHLAMSGGKIATNGG